MRERSAASEQAVGDRDTSVATRPIAFLAGTGESYTSMDDRRTLNELDPPAWGPPCRDDTNLVRRCHELRQTPLAEFGVEDLRIMIGQQVSLPYLIPLATTILQANALAEGDYYPGDLLHAVLRADKSYYATLERADDVVGLGRGAAAPMAAVAVTSWREHPDVRGHHHGFGLKPCFSSSASTLRRRSAARFAPGLP
jgi:CDI immunity proteins